MKINITELGDVWDPLVIPNKTYNSEYALFLGYPNFVMENSKTNMSENIENAYFAQVYMNSLTYDNTEFGLKEFYDYLVDTKKLID